MRTCPPRQHRRREGTHKGRPCILCRARPRHAGNVGANGVWPPGQRRWPLQQGSVDPGFDGSAVLVQQGNEKPHAESAPALPCCLPAGVSPKTCGHRGQRHLAVGGELEISAIDDKKHQDLISYMKTTTAVANGLPVGGERWSEAIDAEFTETQWNLFACGQYAIYYSGALVYRDKFEEHTADFCVSKKVGDPTVILTCRKYSTEP